MFCGDGAAVVEVPMNVSCVLVRDLECFEKRIELLRESLDIPGMSVGIVHKQAVVFARGFGVVDLAKGTEAKADTPYPIASLTKTFAAAVIMRLVEAGKLDLDEPFSACDPEYAQWCARLKASPLLPGTSPYRCDTERITVRHHLTHTAEGKPGSNFKYNGFLFARLSAVVDAVPEKGFIRSVREDILEPLAMTSAALGANDPVNPSILSRMARPYKLNKDWTPVEPSSVSPPFDSVNASVGIISTVLDLAKYDIAIDRDLVYSQQAKRQVWTNGVSPAGQPFPYGLGWFVFNIGGSRMPWHYGWYPDAYSSLLFKVPDRQLTLILMACTDRASSVFCLGNGDPIRSAFVSAFLDGIARSD
jgi:CubicO group peptidase (beta-lactamase class C family)